MSMWNYKGIAENSNLLLAWTYLLSIGADTSDSTVLD
jgi:hypothetical protein